jgi:hypothetical protein
MSIIVVIISMVWAVGNEDMPLNILGEAETDEVLSCETAGLEIPYRNSLAQRESFNIGGPNMAVGINVTGVYST